VRDLVFCPKRSPAFRHPSQSHPTGTSPVPNRLKPCDGNRTGEIQATNVLGSGNPQQTFRVDGRDSLGQATRLTPKDQCILSLIVNVTKRLRRLLAEIPPAVWLEGCLKMLPIIDDLPVQMLPVVEPGPPQPLFINPKTQGPHQPKFSPQGNAGSTNRPGIWCDFWLVQDNV
jgi:hypothetical protein